MAIYGAGDYASRGVGTPIPVLIPLGNNLFRYVGDLPPSRGTGVLIPNIRRIFHGGAQGGGHGNTQRIGRANARAGSRATHFGCDFCAIGTTEHEIVEEEGARLIGIELYNHINFNA